MRFLGDCTFKRQKLRNIHILCKIVLENRENPRFGDSPCFAYSISLLWILSDFPEYRHGMKGAGNLYPLTALVNGAGGLILPGGALGEVHPPGALAGVQDGGYQVGRTEEILRNL